MYVAAVAVDSWYSQNTQSCTFPYDRLYRWSVQNRSRRNNTVFKRCGQHLSSMQDVYGEQCPSKTAVVEWCPKFSNGWQSTADLPRPGTPQHAKSYAKRGESYFSKVGLSGSFNRLNSNFAVCSTAVSLLIFTHTAGERSSRGRY